MALFFTIVFVALGGILLPTSLIGSAIAFGLAALSWRMQSGRGEDALIAVLFTLGTLGALSIIIQGIIQQLS